MDDSKSQQSSNKVLANQLFTSILNQQKSQNMFIKLMFKTSNVKLQAKAYSLANIKSYNF